jgi:hypothetical protein
MGRTRSLSLRRETLAELTSDDLRAVAGAAGVADIAAIAAAHTVDHTCLTCQTSINTRC